MTQCNQQSFGFHALGGRQVVARFDGGRITLEGGGLPLSWCRFHPNSTATPAADGREAPRAQAPWPR